MQTLNRVVGADAHIRPKEYCAKPLRDDVGIVPYKHIFVYTLLLASLA